MKLRRDNHDDSNESVELGSGAASLHLREVEGEGIMSRRGMLWRAGAATVAGVGVLSVLDEQRADAADGGNLVLGAANVATHTTALSPTGAATSPLFNVNGASLGATQTTMEVNGPAGGAALYVTSSSTPSTTGLAINGTGSGTATGVYAASGTGAALWVNGKTHFSRAGVATIAAGQFHKQVAISGFTTSNLVLATLQKYVSGLYVTAVQPGSGHFTIYVSKTVTANTNVAWFVLN